MSHRACGQCKHFTFTAEEQGVCRRYPPTALPTGPDQMSSFFPPVAPSGYCGEWAMAIEMATEMPKCAVPGVVQ